MRFTEKRKNAKYGYKYLGGTDNFGEGCQKLGQLEDLMEKYGFEEVEDLDNFIQSCINKMEYENKKELL